ncbi:MAG: hypothetical protein AAGI89_04500 [Pseudomonadota bacterium]
MELGEQLAAIDRARDRRVVVGHILKSQATPPIKPPHQGDLAPTKRTSTIEEERDDCHGLEMRAYRPACHATKRTVPLGTKKCGPA